MDNNMKTKEIIFIGFLIGLLVYVTLIYSDNKVEYIPSTELINTELINTEVLKGRYEVLLLVGVYIEQTECGCIDLQELVELVENEKLRDELLQSYEAEHNIELNRW